jgi:hypothetical protein
VVKRSRQGLRRMGKIAEQAERAKRSFAASIKECGKRQRQGGHHEIQILFAAGRAR